MNFYPNQRVYFTDDTEVYQCRVISDNHGLYTIEDTDGHWLEGVPGSYLHADTDIFDAVDELVNL